MSTIFSAPPPLEVLKVLLSMVASSQDDKGSWGQWIRPERRFTAAARGRGSEDDDDSICVLYTDISRAYFNAPTREDKFIELPAEDWEMATSTGVGVS